MILVTGATGNVGGNLVRLLADAGTQVRALTRDPDRAAIPAGVTAVTGDLNQPESLSAALAGVSGVFLLPGYRDMPGVLA
ncbi:MAG TPA: NmrA family NAD(P)-binding protein, partial [Streptosporangiaceae bacterium]